MRTYPQKNIDELINLSYEKDFEDKLDKSDLIYVKAKETKTKLTQPQINWRQLAIFCVTGAIIGFAAFSLFLTYILLKNAL